MLTGLTGSTSGKAQQPVALSTITPTDGQLWWGYSNEANQRMGFGQKKAETYDQCIYIHGDNPVVAGTTIKAVRFYQKVTSGIKDIKLWLSTSLPDEADKADYVQDVDLSSLKGGENGAPNDVALNQPYTIGAEGVYVGLSFTITDISKTDNMYPIVLIYSDNPRGSGWNMLYGDEDGFWNKTSETVKNWQDGQRFGNLALWVLVEGEFKGNAVEPSGLGDYILGRDQSTTATITLTNTGNNSVNDLDYQLLLGSSVIAEKHIQKKMPTTGSTATLTIDIPADDQDGTKQLIFNVTKVNGNDNQAEQTATQGSLGTILEPLPRKVVMEDITGTVADACTRSYKAMEMLSEHYGERLIALSIHQYNKMAASQTVDAMEYDNYPNPGWQYIPGSVLNRNGITVDPMYGSERKYLFGITKDVDEALQDFCTSTVEVEGAWSNDSLHITSTATITSPVDLTGYTLAFVVTADSLRGTGTSWEQANWYGSRTTEEGGDPNMADYCIGGKYGQETIADYPFQNVVVASSYNEQQVNTAAAIGTVKAGEPYSQTFTFDLPSRSRIRKSLQQSANNGLVAVVALVIRPDGQIDNAAKAYLSGLPSAINDLSETRKPAPTTCYSPDGRQLDSPRPGINILRMSDGSRRKVVVK